MAQLCYPGAEAHLRHARKILKRLFFLEPYLFTQIRGHEGEKNNCFSKIKPIPLGYCKKWFTLDKVIFHTLAICNNMKVMKRYKFNKFDQI